MSHKRDGHRTVGQVLHTERMYAPWWLWLFLGVVGVGAGALFFMGIVEWWRIAIMGFFPVAVWGVLWWVGRIRVQVVEDADERHFHADDASISTSFISEVEVLESTALRDAMTVALHPLAFVIQRPWMKASIRIYIDDADDPTPYWIVSTRHPHLLRELLLDLDSPTSHPESSTSAPEDRKESSAL